MGAEPQVELKEGGDARARAGEGGGPNGQLRFFSAADIEMYLDGRETTNAVFCLAKLMHSSMAPNSAIIRSAHTDLLWAFCVIL